ncbi:MAG: glycosyltransferase, partial [Anaerolineae bacterium]|nr:glycosyltransferase [Anaerolineae bacterium]
MSQIENRKSQIENSFRVAIIASDYAPTIGGVQTAVRHIARNATPRGHSVIILSSLPSRDVPTHEIIEDVPVYRFAWGRRPLWSLPLRATQTLLGMARVLRAFQPDVVYVHFLTINALYVLLLHYVSRFTLVVSARGNDIQGIPLRSRLQRWMLPRLFARANAILFCSSYVQRDAESYLKHASPRAYIGIVGDGFDPDEFRVPEQVKLEFVVFSANNLIPSMQVDDEEAKKFYEENASKFQGDEERHASHILITYGGDKEAARKKAEA